MKLKADDGHYNYNNLGISAKRWHTLPVNIPVAKRSVLRRDAMAVIHLPESCALFTLASGFFLKSAHKETVL